MVEAAYEVFTAQGYAATAISEVAARAGIGQGTVYRYFGSKREILEHVIDFGIEKVMDSVRLPELLGTATGVGGLTEAVRAAADRVYDLVEREPQLLRLLLVEAAAIDPELAQRLLGLEAITAALVAAELSRGVEAGWIRPDLDTEVVSHTIVMMVGPGLLRQLHGVSDPRERRHTTATLLQLLEKALRLPSVAS
ncbi:TetR/AcrR family transcriptional regulator [Nocardia crassostreae]|uniref:TetR/AcrR family transcriptional regulator n=1 Tax=Nocardia crassostreae TaxID=53428 RepID=UPI000833B88E|nr:TetR/AcrR family transcriptional regulator [Nocardia crassostreae]